MKRVLLLVVCVAVGVAFSSVAFGQDAAAGEKVYAAQKCSMCHAIAGKGNKMNPLDGVGAKLKPEEIREWLADPTAAAAKAKSTKKPPMKSFKALPKADVDALVAYLQSLK